MMINFFFGGRRNFTLETYYDIMSKNFNMLELAGTAHLSTEEQKIIKFESDLKEDKVIRYSITSKSTRDSLPENQRTFDSYYNKFSFFMNKHNTLVQNNPRKVQISQMKMHRQGSDIGQNKRPRFRNSKRRGRRRPCGRRHSYNSYMKSRNMKYTFQPEAEIYSKEEYNNLTANQKGQVLALKQRNGSIYGCTPPPGFQINKVTGEAEPSNHLVSPTIRAATSAMIHEDSSFNSNDINSKTTPLTMI